MEKVIVPNDCIRSEYAPYLFNYGEWNYFIYTYSINNPQFKLQDEHFEKWTKLCIQLKKHLEAKEGNIEHFYSLKNQKIEKFEMPLQSYQIQYQKLTLDYFKDVLCDFENTLRPLYGMTGESISSEFNLEFINEKLNDAEQEYKKLNGEKKKGKPVNLLMLTSHICIQNIADLLRIDEMILSNKQNLNIDDIHLSHAQFRFIYDFLLFFELLGYEIDNINTTKKEDIIYEYLSDSVCNPKSGKYK